MHCLAMRGWGAEPDERGPVLNHECMMRDCEFEVRGIEWNGEFLRAELEGSEESLECVKPVLEGGFEGGDLCREGFG